MDTKAVIDLVDELQDNLEELEDNLASISTTSLATTSRKLPLLDRAKLNVLLVYSIESLLFSYLKIHGVQVKEHPVFKELTRVKQYFAKINAAEKPAESAQPAVKLNKDAAARVIKHDLAGNQQYDLERAEREAREKFLANRRLRDLETKMKESVASNPKNDEDTCMTDALTQAAQLGAVPQEAPAEDATDSESGTDSNTGEEGEVRDQPTQPPAQQGRKRKSKMSTKSRRAKRKRETGFPDVKNPEQMKKALERQAARKAKKEKNKAKKKLPDAAATG